MWVCSKCQRPFDDGAEFCPFDGTALVAGGPSLGGPTADHKTRDSDAPGSSAPDSDEASAHGNETSEDSQLVAISAMQESAADALELTARKRSAVYRGLIGKTLDGRYRIESVLGEGGMGIVFLAKHVVIEKAVAVKVLKKDAAKNESIAKRFVREAQAASRIAHPNIIDVTDFGTTKNGIIYSVMEYVEGSTLAKILRYESPLQVERVLRIAIQMARALEAAHNKGVVHRDLKPENVFLVDRDGRRDFVKIVDFGIARVLPIPGDSEVSRLTRAGTVFGTPEYMAPEQAAGRGDTDHRVDIYALGTIMYEMLSGSVPHRGDSTVRTLAMQMLDPITPLSKLPVTAGIDPEVEAVVHRALEKKREDRWPDMGVFMRAMSQLSDDAETIRVSGPNPLPPTSTTMHEGVPTEVEHNPAGALAVENLETTEHLPGRGATPRTLTTSPTEIYQMQTPKGEPAFVRRSRRPSIDDLISEETSPPDDESSKAWIVALALAVAAAAVVAIVLLVGGEGSQPIAQADPDAATDSLDDSVNTSGSGKVASAGPDDAGTGNDSVTVATRTDATAGKHVGNLRNPDRTTKRPDGGVGVFPRDFEVEVITRPDGGSLWSGSDYAGSSGVVISRPLGTKLRLRCSKGGYKSGHVSVTFSGDKALAVCWLKKKDKCVKDLKNPYAKCP